MKAITSLLKNWFPTGQAGTLELFILPVEEVEKVELGRVASEPYPRHLSHHDPLELELADVEVDPFFGLRMLEASPEAAWLSIFRA